MGHRYGIRIPLSSAEALHEVLISLPSFYARSSSYGYFTDAFETKDADAYLFLAEKNRSSENPHPDMEVVIEPYGLYVNSFCFLEEVENEIAARFGNLEFIL